MLLINGELFSLLLELHEILLLQSIVKKNLCMSLFELTPVNKVR